MTMLKEIFINDFPFVIIHYPEALYKIAMNFNLIPERVCSWVYNSNTRRQHRDVAFFKIKPDFAKVSQPYKNLNDKRIKKRIEEGKTCSLYDWWNINQIKNISKEKTEHPCQMPVEVMKNIIGVLPADSLIIDPFMGRIKTMTITEMREKRANLWKGIGPRSWSSVPAAAAIPARRICAPPATPMSLGRHRQRPVSFRPSE